MMTARYAGFLQRSLPPFWPTADRAMVLAALKRLDETAEPPQPVRRAGAARADRRRCRLRGRHRPRCGCRGTGSGRAPGRRGPAAAGVVAHRRHPRPRVDRAGGRGAARRHRAGPHPRRARRVDGAAGRRRHGPVGRARARGRQRPDASPSTDVIARRVSDPTQQLPTWPPELLRCAAAGATGAVSGAWQSDGHVGRGRGAPPGAAVRPRLRAPSRCSPSGASRRPSTTSRSASPSSRRSGSTPPPTPPASYPARQPVAVRRGQVHRRARPRRGRRRAAGRPARRPRGRARARPHPRRAHKGGSRGKKVLDTLKGSGARVIDAPAIKTDRDKADFAAHEFRRARRKATGEAVHALVEAVGKDVRELASACQQLIDDTTGRHRRAGRADLPRGQGRGHRLPGGRRRHGRRHRGGAAAAAARHRRRGRPGADRRRARPAGAPADQGRLGRARPLGRPGPRPRHGALAGRQGPPGRWAAGPPTRSPPASPPSPRPTSRSRAAAATRSTPSSGACSPSPASTPATAPEREACARHPTFWRVRAPRW